MTQRLGFSAWMPLSLATISVNRVWASFPLVSMPKFRANPGAVMRSSTKLSPSLCPSHRIWAYSLAYCVRYACTRVVLPMPPRPLTTTTFCFSCNNSRTCCRSWSRPMILERSSVLGMLMESSWGRVVAGPPPWLMVTVLL